MDNIDRTKITIDTYNKVAQLYTSKYFDDTSDHPYIDKFITLLPPNPYVLDVGCGPGNTAQYLVNKGCRVEGIDMSEKMLQIAREKVPQAHFTNMDMRTLSFGDDTFDGLISAYSLIHIPSGEIFPTLREFVRVLKLERYMCLITQKGKQDQLVTDGLSEDSQMFYNFFTEDGLKNDLEVAGFTIISQEEVFTPNTYNLSDSILYTIAQKVSS